MSIALRDYAEAAGPEVIDALERLARPLKGRRVVHVNSTRIGNRPCNSGIKSDGFERWNAPAAMKTASSTHRRQQFDR